MKTNFTIILAATAILTVSFSCTKVESVVRDRGQVYNVTTQIRVADTPETRALDESGSSIAVSFETTEHVYVCNVTDGYTMLDGSLQPQSSGADVTLKGSLTGSIVKDDVLKLIYPKSSINYGGQDGTLSGIASDFDFATASVSVSSASASDVITSSADMNSQQSITKFSFKCGTRAVAVSSLTISGTGLVKSIAANGVETTGNITLTLASPGSTVYVAMRNSSGSKQTYTFSVTDSNGVTYTGTKKANLVNGKYYNAEVDLYQDMEYVDLGVSVKWAKTNVGAPSQEAYGDYVAWGETDPYYETLSPKTWKTDKSGGYTIPNYCGASSFTEWATAPYGDADAEGLKHLKAENDFATVRCGAAWRTPTKSELNELLTSCTWEYVTSGVASVNLPSFTPGVNGFLVFKGKDATLDTSAYIFIPNAGYFGGANNNSTDVMFWTATLYVTASNKGQHAYLFKPTGTTTPAVTYSQRRFGYPVRPVYAL